jgi:hypothetical protein
LTAKSKEKIAAFKFSKHTRNITINKSIHDYEQQIKRKHHNIKRLQKTEEDYKYRKDRRGLQI